MRLGPTIPAALEALEAMVLKDQLRMLISATMPTSPSWLRRRCGGEGAFRRFTLRTLNGRKAECLYAQPAAPSVLVNHDFEGCGWVVEPEKMRRAQR